MTWKQLFLAARPKTLIAIIFPLTMVLLYGQSQGLPVNYYLFLVCLFCGLFIQISTNYFNDYYDFIKGSDQNRVGPERLTEQIKNKSVMRYLGIFFILLSFITAIPLYQLNIAFFFIGLSACFFSFAYTGGPFPLAYNGLGEVFVLLYFGFVLVLGSAYAIHSDFEVHHYFLAGMVGLLNVKILMANNLRDYESDKEVGKKTLAVFIGLIPYKILFSFMAIAALYLKLKLDGTSRLINSFFGTLVFTYLILLWRARQRSQRRNFFGITLLYYFSFFILFLVNYL